MKTKLKKKTKVSLERMLLEPIPETPIPEPYFNIPSPEPYVFPLNTTLLEGIKLLENYFPEDINNKIKVKLHGRSIERMSKYKETYCLLGKGGNGLLIGDQILQYKGITAFAYGPQYLIIAFDDLRLDIYSMQLKLIKSIKSFSTRRVTYLKILTVPKNYESIIILTNIGSKLNVHRIEKSFFSVLSVKFSAQIISDLHFPVTQIIEIHPMHRLYLQRDVQFRNCNLFAVAAIHSIYIFSINYAKLDSEMFWKKIYFRKGEDVTCSWISWGQANIQAPSRQMKGDKLILTYSFDNRIYFAALRQIEKYDDNQTQIKCEWIQSYPFQLTKRVAFCQYIKKSQVLIVTEENTVLIFHTKNFDIFQKALKEDQVEMQSQPSNESLQVKLMSGVKKNEAVKGATEDDLILLSQGRNISYADTFLYEFPSNQVYFLTQHQFGVYVYCNWRLIADLLKVEQKYECAMIFLIALHKKANRFDLDIQGQQKQLSQYIQMLCIQYINKKLIRIKQVPEILNELLEKQDYLKMIVIPLEFLTETDQFNFLFQVARDKIIMSLTAQQTEAAYTKSQIIFFKVLQKFIQHGRIKFIPELQLKAILDYYVKTDQLEMIDRLAIYFDLSRIDRNIVIQCLLQNNLVVSLAHICTQGNQSQFVTPFVKFWGSSENHKIRNEPDFAAACAFRALWYVKLCLQRNWILKEYSFDKYAKMITILSQHFLTQKILVGLLSLRPSDCLNTLSYYFTIENCQIINESDLKLPNIVVEPWIQQRQGNQKQQILLSTISGFLKKALRQNVQQRLSLFLSSIIIYKTVRFTQEKYYNILINLIRNYSLCKEVNYGLEQKMLNEYIQQFSSYSQEQIVDILSAKYINKILTLVYYQYENFIKGKLMNIYEESRMVNLIDLQAEISFLQGNYNNCIDIYKRSKNTAQILLFQFLENSFKRLILEKRKDQKMILANCIKKQIKYMATLDHTKTKNLVQNYVPQIQQELIQALNEDEELQLQFLQGIVNDDQRQQMKKKLSQRSILRFIELMAKYKPDGLIEAFKKNNNFSIKESLKICEKYDVYDCMEYLYERMGNITASVKIATLRIDRILKSRNEFDQENFAPYIKIKEILDNAIEVCRKNHSEEIWESLLDSSIELYQKYENSELPEDEIEIFFYINGEIMQNLASNCSIQHTINLLQNKYANLNMGGKMTKAFINILSDLSHSINIYYIATNLIQLSLQRVLKKDYFQKIHCFNTDSYCRACRFPLTKRKETIHFRCGHAYHAECAIAKDPVVCVECLGDKSDQFSYYINTLNPRYPKIKKVDELIKKFEEKRFQMSQIIKIEEYQRNGSENHQFQASFKEKRISRFSNFDENINYIESGNRRVLQELKY